MNLANLVYSALGSLFTNGLYPGKLPESSTPPATPYGVFIHFGPSDIFLDGRGKKQNQRLQVDIYAATYDDAATLANSVETVMDALGGSPTLFMAVTQLSRHFLPPEAETHLQRIMLEFSVWYQP